MTLDEINKQILSSLYKAGRESLSSLSKIVLKSNQATMSHAGISKRISKLEKSNILKVQGNLSIKALNYVVSFVLIEIKNFEREEKISKAYSECPRVFLLAHLTGQYDLIMGIVSRNIDDLRRYINYCGPTNKEGILHSVILSTSDLILPKFFPVKIYSGLSKEHKCENICSECVAFFEGNCGGCGNF